MPISKYSLVTEHRNHVDDRSENLLAKGTEIQSPVRAVLLVAEITNLMHFWLFLFDGHFDTLSVLI